MNSLCLKIKLYLFTTSCGCFFACCKTKRNEDYLEILNECDLEADLEFDIGTMIEKQKKYRREIDMVKENLGIEEHESFNVKADQVGV